MAFRHYLIYSQSDQQTLRASSADAAYHGVAVPGTIAGYFPDATASFILTSKRPYFIDLKTPLFQGDLLDPKPSHLALAEKLSPSLATELQGSGHFAASFYTDDVIVELVEHSIGFQRNYADQASSLSRKLDKYAKLRAVTRGEAPPADAASEALAPELIVSPYFCGRTIAGDPWLEVNRRIWEVLTGAEFAGEVSPVVALDSEEPGQLAEMLALVPPSLNNRVLFWLTGFDERSEPKERLLALWRVIAAYSGQFELINLYGSYFSIVASQVGLTGMSNGIGYSEFRRWPELASSGAAPARYYVPRLHAFLPPGDAQLLVDTDSWFACDCVVCREAERQGAPAIIALSYHGLKQHFVLCREAEIAFASSHTLVEVEAALVETLARVASLRRGEEEAVPRVPAGHLATWADVFQELTTEISS
jgi:hypothetical protein